MIQASDRTLMLIKPGHLPKMTSTSGAVQAIKPQVENHRLANIGRSQTRSLTRSWIRRLRLFQTLQINSVSSGASEMQTWSLETCGSKTQKSCQCGSQSA